MTDFGDPSAGELLELCVYDQTAPGTYALILGGAPSVSGGGAWTGSARGWKFQSTTGGPDGIIGITLKAGTAPLQAKVRVKARNSPSFGPLPAAGDTIIAQFRTSLGTCWGGSFSTPSVSSATEFRAKSD
jgi:hypothetical protein